MKINDLLKVIKLLKKCPAFEGIDYDRLYCVIRKGMRTYKNFADKIIEIDNPYLIYTLLVWADLSPQQIVKIVNSDSYKHSSNIRKLVAGYVNTPKTVLLQLTQDRDKDIANKARKTIKNSKKEVTVEGALLYIINSFFREWGDFSEFIEFYMKYVPKRVLNELIKKCKSVKSILTNEDDNDDDDEED